MILWCNDYESEREVSIIVGIGPYVRRLRENIINTQRPNPWTDDIICIILKTVFQTCKGDASAGRKDAELKWPR